ncbi:MAG TPA: type II CRISPR-associated endonuclease Cas1 [Parvularcula sp.]|nr:type II CRISPR-associated endonuclease Cas1 [Parvularcula sp.]HBS31848.1 type II CRISPR-associated endonuclease Cas1 [Parvularcula sp.]HBS34444.1 type II CRISPR-associated endonuclease Cas1 [Parvularcula sp.]
MAWKGLHLTKPVRLSLSGGQIVAALDEGEVKAPLEDIAYVIIDTPQATLTSGLVSAAMDAGVAMLFADARHAPSGLLLPFHRHHLQGAVVRLQVEARESLKGRLWRDIVRAKILNQAAALALAGRDGAEMLKETARHVEPGDPGNVEARAARNYWGRFFDGYTRDSEGDLRNKLLNYGYAVIRASVARALVAVGLVPAIGLKHDGAANAFNLADDLVEPFRPFVDLLARKTAADRDAVSELTIDDRRAMAGALMLNAALRDGKMTLLAAAEKSAASLVRAFEAGQPALLDLPSLEDAP